MNRENQSELSRLQAMCCRKQRLESQRVNVDAQQREILEGEEQLSKSESRIRELKEAIQAGRQAQSIIRLVYQDLDSAERYGTWDIFGGGLLADLGKHEHLDSAQNHVEHLQGQLNRFQTELADVDIRADIQIQINGFMRFADFFFDGIFADWAVMNRMEEARNQVEAVERQVIAVLKKLEELLVQEEQERERLAGELERLLVEA